MKGRAAGADGEPKRDTGEAAHPAADLIARQAGAATSINTRGLATATRRRAAASSRINNPGVVMRVRSRAREAARPPMVKRGCGARSWGRRVASPAGRDSAANDGGCRRHGPDERRPRNLLKPSFVFCRPSFEVALLRAGSSSGGRPRGRRRARRGGRPPAPAGGRAPRRAGGSRPARRRASPAAPACLRAVDHRDRDRVVERHHRVGRDGSRSS